VLGPILEGERVRLEPPRAEFLPTYVGWFADPLVTRYLLHRFPPTPKQEEEWLEATARDPHQIVWAIVLRESGKLLGATGIENINWRNRRGNSGIMIGERDEWGKGYATEAMRLRTRYAFHELGFETITTSVILPNDASRKALERVGYRQCGLRHRHQLVDGVWRDAWLGEILREDWERSKESER
jgi:RimJ/RimL family protein N-acetyltransferase